MSDTNISEAAERLERAYIAGMDEEFRDDLRFLLDALPHLHPQPAELAEQQGVDLLKLWEATEKLGSMFDEHLQRFANALAATGKQQVGEVLTDTYVQTVPDKCDRIVWRGHYYHLPIKQAGEVQANQVQPVAHSDSQWIK